MLQISLVMPSWLLEYIPPLFFLSLSPFQWPSLFAMYVRGTYQVAAGFLFSGNVLDVWKATWSDLRDTTCRRFIISFPLLFKGLCLFMCLSSWGAGWTEKDWGGLWSWIVTMFPSVVLFWSDCQYQRCVFCVPLLFEVEECWLRSHWEKQCDSFWEECARHKQYGRSGGVG